MTHNEDVTRILPAKRPDYFSNQVFFVLTNKDVKEGVYPLHLTHLNLLSNEMKT